MNLNDAVIGQTYTIKEICTDDADLELFLFRLGCYSGEHRSRFFYGWQLVKYNYIVQSFYLLCNKEDV